MNLPLVYPAWKCADGVDPPALGLVPGVVVVVVVVIGVAADLAVALPIRVSCVIP